MPNARRRRRWLLVIGLAVVLLLSTGFAVLRIKYEGEDLGSNIASILNKRMRGRIEIGSIEWSTSSLKTLVTGGWIPVTVRNVRVWDDCALSAGVAGDEADELRTGDPNEDCTPDDRPDPDPSSKRKPRKLVLRTPKITGEIDIHALVFGNHDFVFRNVWVHGGEALIEQTREPYPLHAYDRTIVSIVTAFYPRMKAGFRAGIYANTPPPIFDIRDVHIEDLNLTVHMTPYSLKNDRVGYVTTARLEGVYVDAGPEPKNDSYLYMDPVDPLVAKFYVRLGVTARRGLVRVFDEGPRGAFRLPYRGGSMHPLPGAGAQAAIEVWPSPERTAEYQIGLTEIQLNRLAQLPTDWSRRDFVANTLELDLQARTVPCKGPGKGPDDNADPATGAALHLTGELHQWWDRPFDGSWNLALDGKNLGPTMRSCIDSGIGGDDLAGRISLTGPFIANPAIGLDLESLDVDIPLSAKEEPLRLTLAEVHGRIDMVNEQGYIEKTRALIRGGKEPGEVDVSATFGLKPYNANAQVEIVKAIDVGRFLPKQVSGPVGKYLQGRLRAKGDKTSGFALEEFDLALGATPFQRAIRVHKGRLFTDDSFDTVHIQHVHVNAGKSHAVFHGKVMPLADVIDLVIEGNFPDLDVWLARFGLPQFVRSAGGGSTITIRGKLSAPTIAVQTDLGGVPCLDRVRVEQSTIEGSTIMARISSAGLGGDLRGDVKITRNAGLPRIDRLHIDGKKIDAARLCGLKGYVKGTIDSLEADLANVSIDPDRSAMDWFEHARVYARAEKLSVLDDKYSNVGVCINRKDDSTCRPRSAYTTPNTLAQCEQGKKGDGFCAVATATRDMGGVVDATIVKLPATRVARGMVPERLGGTIALHDLPIAILESFVDARAAGGLASATLHLEGPPSAPQATGAIQLLRSWVGAAFLGDAQIAIEPTTIGKIPGIAFSGRALAGRMQLRGRLGTQAPFPVELTLTGRRIELDVLLDIQKRFGLPVQVQAWASGTITIKTELAPPQPVEPEAWIELTELWATIVHRTEDGRRVPLHFKVIDTSNGARPAVSLRVTPQTIELACKDPAAKGGRVACSTSLATPAGIVEIRGSATPKRFNIEANGNLDFAQIAPLFDTMFEDLRGSAVLRASVSGTFDKPSYEAALELKNIEAQPSGGDTVLRAPSGLIKLANGSLGFTDVKLQVKDRHRDEAGELHVKGNITFDGLSPVGWAVLIGGPAGDASRADHRNISGKLAGKMLLVALPDYVSQASGLARIDGDIVLSGRGAIPNISGTIVFDPLPVCPPSKDVLEDGGECRPPGDQYQPLNLIVRGLRRELTFTTGSIDLETEVSGARQTFKISVNRVRSSIDGEGALQDIDGKVELVDGSLTKLALELDAENIPFRIPGTLDLIVSASNIKFDKPSESSTLIIGGPDSKITLIDGRYTRNFTITDQIVSIGAGGAPSKPFWEEYPAIGNAELALSLEVKQFEVKNNIAQISLAADLISISNTPRDPRLSGDIRVRRGNFRIPGTRARFENTSGEIRFSEIRRAGNPDLNIETNANYRDPSGQDHLITLSLTGSLERVQWDLKTSTGYDKSQTLSLLVLGRNPEQLRRSLGDQQLGGDVTNVDPSTNPSQGFADQIVKDLAGDWVSSLLGDSVGKYTPFDVLRIEIGFGSIGLRAEKRFLDNLQALGDYEQTLRGNTRSARAEVKTALPGQASGQVGYLNKDFNDPAEEDIVDWSAKFVFKFFLGQP